MKKSPRPKVLKEKLRKAQVAQYELFQQSASEMVTLRNVAHHIGDEDGANYFNGLATELFRQRDNISQLSEKMIDAACQVIDATLRGEVGEGDSEGLDGDDLRAAYAWLNMQRRKP